MKYFAMGLLLACGSSSTQPESVTPGPASDNEAVEIDETARTLVAEFIPNPGDQVHLYSDGSIHRAGASIGTLRDNTCTSDSGEAIFRVEGRGFVPLLPAPEPDLGEPCGSPDCPVVLTSRTPEERHASYREELAGHVIEPSGELRYEGAGHPGVLVDSSGDIPEGNGAEIRGTADARTRSLFVLCVLQLATAPVSSSQ
ncbi:MAG: hypothetical protein AAGE52_09255 [Myxococcota bacterium]